LTTISVFNANQRRNIKRERKSLEKAGIRMEAISGDEISKPLCNLMYDYYSDTCDKFGWWGSKYLTRKFFQLLHHDYRHRMVFFAAYHDDSPEPIGMSFCLTKGDRLYGRYWGSKYEINHLHFNACYYAPIEWAIATAFNCLTPGPGVATKNVAVSGLAQLQPAPLLSTPTPGIIDRLYQRSEWVGTAGNGCH
jgi:predicted N-acyltransferase